MCSESCVGGKGGDGPTALIVIVLEWVGCRRKLRGCVCGCLRTGATVGTEGGSTAARFSICWMPGSSLFSSCSGGGRIDVVESLAGLKEKKWSSAEPRRGGRRRKGDHEILSSSGQRAEMGLHWGCRKEGGGILAELKK